MPTLSDPADALLARDDELEISTQHTEALDSAPDFRGSQENEEALFAGLAGRAKRVRLPAKAGVRQMRPRPGTAARPQRLPGRPNAGFMPGMGDMDDMDELAGPPARRMQRPTGTARRALPPARGQAPRRLPGRPNAGFMPGMGDLAGPGPIPRSAARLGEPRDRVLARGINKSRVIPMRRRSGGGFIPGLGADLSVAGMGIGTLALLAAGAWFLFGRKRA